MQNNQQNTNRIARNTLYLYMRMILVTLVSLYTSRIVLQTLGVDDFGIYSVVASIIVFFSFFNNALKTTTTRYIAFELGTGNRERLKQIYSMSINCHIMLAIAVGIILEVVGVWLLNNRLNIAPERLSAANWVFQFSLLTFCVGIIQIPFDSCIIAHEKMNFYALISIVEAVGKLGVAYLLIFSHFDKLILYAALLSVIAVLVMLCYWIYCRIRLSDCSYIRFWDKSLISDFASYSGWSLLVNTTDVVVIQGRSILVNIFLGVVANAALGIAGQVYNALAMFARNFASAFNPQIYKSYAAGDKSYFMQLIFTTSKISYCLLLLPLIPLLLNLPFVLDLWLGRGTYPLITSSYICAMMLFAILDAAQAPLWNAIFATGDIRVHQIMMGIIKISVLPLTWWLLRNGDNGVWVLWVWGLGNLLCAIVRTLYAHWAIQLDLRHYLKDVVGRISIVTLLTLPLPLTITLYVQSGWMTLLLSTLLSCLLLGIFTFYIGLTGDERKYMQQLITAKLKHKQA
ncbi:MAG: MATE family efflux transporter [Paludibacter sp.]|nr:MATE family efflux transporter [Bacteroidales bacterium]MCM1069885.1 MATE family efflux transporter [Prevotella sp.]MCM1354566.1 MATE family efflux transporter [Bacteroides sp.]MCM1443461.1 MATE family efflux transporter [Muribaculum sp.]MCM1482545.1 MATE family efflux transporter [Paludibacter sp.]